MKVPLFNIPAQVAAIRPELDRAIRDVLDAAAFVDGDRTLGFEAEFAAACGTRHGVGVASGTAAVELALAAVGVGPGHEVITSPFTFIGTTEAITRLGARPVFADVEPDTGNLDPARAGAAVTDRTRALLPVHLYGHPADLDAFTALAAEGGLTLVEDACQAHLAEYRGRRIGGFGRAAAFSFYPTKNLGAGGDAGAVTTDDPDTAAALRLLKNHGRTAPYAHAREGYNHRMDEIQAAILRVKLARLPEWTAARRAKAAVYDRELAGLDLVLPSTREGCLPVYHLYTVQTDRRDSLQAALRAEGIGSGVYYPTPLHPQPAYRELGHREGDFPEAERLARQVLSLPLYPELTDDQQARVIATLRAACAR